MNPVERNRLVNDIFLSFQTNRSVDEMIEILGQYGIDITEVDTSTLSDVKSVLNLASDKILLQIAKDLKLTVSNYLSEKKEKPYAKKVYISHSKFDDSIARSFAEILQVLGVQFQNIYCTSLDDYNNLKKGNSIQENLKFLNETFLVFFILSNNYYESPSSMAEMGIAYERTENQICVVVKPFKLDLIEGYFEPLIGINLHGKMDYDILKEIIENKLGLVLAETFPWEPIRAIIFKLIQLQLINSKLDDLKTL